MSLPTKLLIAVLPLMVALGGLLTLTIRDGFSEIDRARLGAELGATWEPLVTTMRAIETERAVTASGDPAAITGARRATNQLMVDMDTSLRRLGDSQPLLVQLGQALQTLGAARGAADNPATGVARGVSADDSFNATKANLVAVGRLLPTQSGDAELARDLTTVAALAELEQGSIVVVNGLQAVGAGVPTAATLDRLMTQMDRVDASVNLFRATSDDRWTTEFRDSGFARALSDTRRAVQQLAAAQAAGDTAATLSPIDAARLGAPVEEIAELRDALALEVVAASDAEASRIATQTRIQVAITAAAVLLALGLAFFVVRSITRRVRTVSGAAREVSAERLPVLVDALRDPRGRTELPDVIEIDDRGSDELAELARSFNSLQTTLGEVAQEQIEVLRRGVSDIFVTMARRNRSLVDRQLQLLDELEAAVEDPEVLSDYYRLDHLATRMRRNSESLLVLANTDTMRRRNKPASIDDVVRAAIGEVEDYRRVDIMSLEHLNVRGAIVADVAHLLAELLDNATAFSPPSSRVQITGDLIDGVYRILILDDGMGIGDDRLAELNDLLAHPPVIGLSVEPTLGMSVVSLLAAKHGVTVQLAKGATGTIVKVLLPEAAFERRVTARSDDHDLPDGQLSLRASPLQPATPSSVLTDVPNVDDILEAPTEPAATPATPSRRERAKTAKREKAAAKARAKSSKQSKRSKHQQRADARQDARSSKQTTTGTTSPSSNGTVAGDPLTVRLPDQFPNTLEIRPVDPPSHDLSELAASDLHHINELNDLGDLGDLPTRSARPSRDETERRETTSDAVLPSRPRSSAERSVDDLDLDLANLDITPSWARDGAPVDAEPVVAEPAVAETPPAPGPAPAPPETGQPASAPGLSPPGGPLLPPPSGGPVTPATVPSPVAAPQPVRTSAPVPPPPPPMPTRGTDGLPLRSRSGSSSALLEVDRLGDGTSISAAGPPSALKDALTAFDSGRQGARTDRSDRHDHDHRSNGEDDRS